MHDNPLSPSPLIPADEETKDAEGGYDDEDFEEEDGAQADSEKGQLPLDSTCTCMWHVMAEQIRTPNLSSGVSDKQSSGSSLNCRTCVLKQDTSPLLRSLDWT